MTIYERIKNRRKELGLNADDVAKALGVSRSTIYRYESADIEKLPIDIVVPLANVLQTTPEFLLGWNDSYDDEADDNKSDLVEEHITNSDFSNDHKFNNLLKIFSSLSPEDQDKVLELARLFELNHTNQEDSL